MWTFDRLIPKFAAPHCRTSSPLARLDNHLWRPLKTAGLIFALWLVAALPLFAVGWSYRVIQLSPNIYLWKPENILEMSGEPEYSRPSNVGFVVTPDGVLVINTSNSPFHARDVLYEIRQHTSAPVRIVVDTDASPARILGNEVFADFKPQILATASAFDAIRRYRQAFKTRFKEDGLFAVRMRGFHPTLPTASFTGEMDKTLGGTKMRLIDLGDCSSRGQAAVFLPGEKVVFLGGVFENGFVPHIAGGDIRHWIAELKIIEGWDADVFVPGNGLPGSKHDVEKFRQFLIWLKGAVASRIARGEPVDQVVNELTPFSNGPWFAPELERHDVREVYSELKVKATPHSKPPSPKNP